MPIPKWNSKIYWCDLIYFVKVIEKNLNQKWEKSK